MVGPKRPNGVGRRPQRRPLRSRRNESDSAPSRPRSRLPSRPRDVSIRPGWFWHESENDRVGALAKTLGSRGKELERAEAALGVKAHHLAEREGVLDRREVEARSIDERQVKTRQQSESGLKEVERQERALAGESKRLEALARTLREQRAEIAGEEKKLRADEKEIGKTRRELQSHAAHLSGQSRGLEAQRRETERRSEDLDKKQKQLHSREATLESQASGLDKAEDAPVAVPARPELFSAPVRKLQAGE